jgi:hypothetical protein
MDRRAAIKPKDLALLARMHERRAPRRIDEVKNVGE